MKIKLLTIIVTGVSLSMMGACGVNNANEEQNILDPNAATISSMNTSLNSNQYPETVPMLTDGAKYEFRIADGRPGGMHNFDGGDYRQQDLQNKQYQQYTQQPRQQSQRVPQAPQEQVQQIPKQQVPKQQVPKQQTQKTQQAAPAAGISAAESKVVQLTNVERRKSGLPDLQMDTALSKVAHEKANDMQSKHYFSHTSPTYGSPFDMMRDFGITYRSAGENIAQGQTTPEEVVQAWMNSEGHRRNILSADYTHIGVGYTQTGNYWSQMFIKK
ncbi:MAG TPA: hypothetical protein GXX18_07400 [Bacillales bacterium]|nr:hypothetical protein [Bacillales bacterium]